MELEERQYSTCVSFSCGLHLHQRTFPGPCSAVEPEHLRATAVLPSKEFGVLKQPFPSARKCLSLSHFEMFLIRNLRYPIENLLLLNSIHGTRYRLDSCLNSYDRLMKVYELVFDMQKLAVLFLSSLI